MDTKSPNNGGQPLEGARAPYGYRCPWCPVTVDQVAGNADTALSVFEAHLDTHFPAIASGPVAGLR